jgi:GTP-binding protein YchF
MALRCGIVGLPNVGKSTLFNALTDAGIAAENYPFCTIEPNSGVVPVPDSRLAALDEIVSSAQVIPATVEFVDIAGLVRGASQGEGLGNQFLGHVRETRAIVHVVRCFEDPDVTHVDGGVDPVRDTATIETELGLADLETLEKRLDRLRRNARAGGKPGEEARREVAFLEELVEHLSNGAPARSFEVPDAFSELFASCHLLTAKPVLYVANVDEKGLAQDDEATRALEAHAASQGAGCVRICGKIEAELSELSTEERALFLEDLGIEEPGLNRLIRAAYELLSLITYFTAGPKEVRAWTIRRGTAAPQAAAEIHTDFERGFIRAEIIPFDAYIACRGEVGAKAAGKMRVEGKEYIVQDGDVVHFRVGT